MADFSVLTFDVIANQGQRILISAHVSVPQGKSLPDDAVFSFNLPLPETNFNKSYRDMRCYAYHEGKDNTPVETDLYQITSDFSTGIAEITVNTPLIKYNKDFTFGCAGTATDMKALDSDIIEKHSLFTITEPTGKILAKSEFNTSVLKKLFASSSITRNDKLSIRTTNIHEETQFIHIHPYNNVRIPDFFPTSCSLTIEGQNSEKVTVSKNLDKSSLFYEVPILIPEGLEILMECDFAQSPISFAPVIWGYPSIVHVEGLNKKGVSLGFDSISPIFERNDEDEENDKASSAASFGVVIVVTAAIITLFSFIF